MRKKWLAIIGVVAIVAAGAGYLAGVYIAAPNLYSSAQDRAIGANVSVTGPKVPRGMKAAMAAVSLPLGSEFQALGSAIDVTPSGPLPAPVMLQFKLNRHLTQSDLALIVTSESAKGPWTLLQPTISKDGWFASVQTTHLSIFGVVEVIRDKVTDFLKKFVAGLTGNLITAVSPPQCEKDIYKDPTAKQAGYSTSWMSNSARSALYWCFGIENSKPTLKIVNKLRYPIQVSHPGFTFLHDSGPLFQLDLDQLARLGAGQDTILFPFEEADYTLDLKAGSHATISTDFANLAEGLALFQSMVSTVLAVAAFVSRVTIEITQLSATIFDDGQTVTIEVSKTTETVVEEDHLLKVINDFLDSAECVNAIAAVDVGAMLRTCILKFGSRALLGTLLGVAVAPIVLTILTASSIAESILSFLDYARDSYDLTAEYFVTISRAALAPPPTNTGGTPLPQPPSPQPPSPQPPSPQPPSGNATIQIGWSSAHATWIWMTLKGFTPGVYRYTCTFSTGGDATFNITVSSNPQTFDNAKTCYDTVNGDVVWVVIGSVASNKITVAAPPPPQPQPSTVAETAGSAGSGTFTNYTNAGGTLGQRVAAYQTVQVSCRRTGWSAPDGDNWWYLIASSPWSNAFYAPADNFYNNGQTSGSLSGTPFVDTHVPLC